jgi:predicted tellurium resistance membrane protein TerC
MSGLELLLTPENVATFLTLTFLEIVLAGDNLVLIAILASKLPEHQRPLARRIGLLAAVVTRILLLFSLFWLSHLETPIKLSDTLSVTPRQIVFTLGGIFLLWKSITELSSMLFGNDGMRDVKVVYQSFAWVILQIAFFDIIFSLDSVIAAIGIAQHVEIMVAAVLVATAVMFFLVNPVSTFIERHRIVKVAALDLLVLIGAFLIAEAFHYELPRAELYIALIVVLIFQALLLWLRGLPRNVRYGLIIVGTVALAAFALLLINDPALAADLQARALDAWRTVTNAMNDMGESVKRMLPAEK